MINSDRLERNKVKQPISSTLDVHIKEWQSIVKYNFVFLFA
jgi:hypothetical protein